MTIFVDSILESNLGYSAVFAYIGMGFLFWSGKVLAGMSRFLLIGEVFHIAGFLFMACGAYRFSSNEYAPKFFLAIEAWVASIAFLRVDLSVRLS